MSTLRLDAYCGLYCGACEVINARTDHDKARVIEMFEAGVPNWHASPDDLHCSGCKTDDVFINCGKCPIRPCAKDKGVEFCVECGEFPCQIYGFLMSAADNIPCLKHLRAIVMNQEFIREKGVEPWLKSQKAKWECPDCGAPFAWYTKQCARCGRNLVGIKDYETLHK
jgi:hypothetical protein